jgi:hypothetical protein
MAAARDRPAIIRRSQGMCGVSQCPEGVLATYHEIIIFDNSKETDV